MRSQISRKIILHIVHFHAHGAMSVNPAQHNGETSAYSPVGTGPCDVHITMEVVVHIVVAIVNVARALMVMSYDYRCVVVMFSMAMRNVPV